MVTFYKNLETHLEESIPPITKTEDKHSNMDVVIGFGSCIKYTSIIHTIFETFHGTLDLHDLQYYAGIYLIGKIISDFGYKSKILQKIEILEEKYTLLLKEKENIE